MDEGQPLTDGEVPSATPTPPIRIQLYDGQQITGRLHHPGGRAPPAPVFYRVSVTL
ncbi:hypothetical protein OG741_37740 [Streptomyces sp. NBC_01410]|uniref:hypothetical protein n=1 Tax=Streptomyces sp. NBC_01410 TaxID=2903856 RepID=UPI00324691A0